MARRRWSAALVLAGLVALTAPAADMPTTASASGPSPATAEATAALAARPPMGVNDWNATGCTDVFDEAWVRAQADALVTTGLRDVGYRFVDLDDCWAAPQRDGAGRLVADPVRFPHGIAALAAYVHDRGLLLGIYTSAGTRTCDARGFAGSLGHERADAASFASWGVDYVKDDDCNTLGTDAATRYAVMARALRETGRPIVLAVCDKGSSAPWRWAPGIAQLWRTTPDVSDDWASVSAIVRRSLPLAAAAGPGRWNDPDMLEVGNGGLTADEERTQVAVWSVLAAPLLAGTDVAAASPATLALLGNRDLVAVDQDPLGLPPRVVADTGGVVVLDRTLTGGSVTAVVNLSDHAVPGGLSGRDLVTGAALAPTTPLPAHATAMVRRPRG